MTKSAVLKSSALNARKALLDGAPDIDTWPALPLDSIPEEHQDGYLIFKFAVTLWVKLVPEQVILDKLKTQYDVVLRQGRIAKLVHRCLRKDPVTGGICGFLGCVPGQHLPNDHVPLEAAVEGRAPADRTRTRARELGQLFAAHPKIEATMIRLVKTRRLQKDGPQFPALSVAVIVECFYALCQDAELDKTGEWPFEDGLKKKGYEAIRRWYHQKKFDNPSQAAVNELGDEVGDILGKDYRRIGIRSLNIPMKMAYERVEIDEHYRDAMFSAVWPRANGEYITLPASRVWALAAIECACHAVLGTHVAMGDRYDRNDVSRLILNTLSPPPRPTKLMFGDPQYQLADTARYPGEIPGFERNSYQTLAWDGHRTHLSARMVADAMAVMHCEVAAERVGDSTARPNIEGWFNTITRFDHMLPSSTGSRPDSPERRDPEGIAQSLRIYMPLAYESLDVIGRTHNITPLHCLDGSTPLERLQELAKQGRVFHSPIGELSASQLHLLLPRMEAKLTEYRAVGDRHGVLGVYADYARYTSRELNECKELRFATDKGCTLFFNEDARSAWLVTKALPGRRFLVTIAGRWSEMPHNYLYRRYISRLGAVRKAEWMASSAKVAIGAMRGLAAAATDDAAAARMMAGINAFAERFQRGQVTAVDVSQTEVEDALAYSLSVEPEDDIGPPMAEEPVSPTEVATVSRDALGGVDDPFGLRK